ncbi:MAG: leucyl aminopeptidase [Burkholderiaceae bacterium]
MQFSIKPLPVDKTKTGCLLIPVLGQKRADGSALTDVVESAIKAALKTKDLASAPGSNLLLHVDGQAKRILLISVGSESKATPQAYVDACKAAYRKALTLGTTEVISLLGQTPVADQDPEWLMEQEILAARTVAYRFDQFKGSKPANLPSLSKVALGCPPARSRLMKPVLVHAQATANGMDLTRDLGNTPGNVCTPTYLADTAKKMGREFKFKVQVLEKKQIAQLKMLSFLSVAQGSAQPPKFIIMQYNGAAASKKPVVLVGKGITFDTGGISLKPGAGMDEMKYDMGGAASVLGTMRAVVEMKLKINLVVIVPTCENMPSSTATRPGDIVKSMSGQTIEILNTDAEGRLILCDALTYAERFKPQAVIDLATLTGACVVALGHHHTGLFSREDELADELIAAGKNAMDTCWRMPIDEAYQKQLKSPFADMANIGGRDAGAITAACFLERFTRAYDWAHLDIAGTAWHSGANKGSSGRPVAMLTRFLATRSAS